MNQPDTAESIIREIAALVAAYEAGGISADTFESDIYGLAARGEAILKPTASVTPRWIPVTESLPDDDQEVAYRWHPVGQPEDLVTELGSKAGHGDELEWQANYSVLPTRGQVTHWLDIHAID